MNIAILCEGFSRRSLLLQPWHRVYDISKRMAAKKGLSVIIISDKNRDSPYREEIDGIAIARIDRSKLTRFLERRALKRVILENDVDVIVWCGAPSSAIQLTHIADQMGEIGVPIVWETDMDIQNLKDLNRLSFRELIGSGHSFLLPKLMVMACSKFIIKRVANSDSISRIVVPSHFIKNSFSKIGVNPNKISVISSTIDKKDFRISDAIEINLLRYKLGLGQTDFIVTYFGSPCTMRGTDIAILSMKRILASKKNAKLVLLSRRDANDSSVQLNTSNNPGGQHSRDEEEYLKRLTTRLGIERNVEIISGIMSKFKLRNYLLVSDVVALPFKYVFSEPPLSILEAMSLGKAVVTTNLGTLSEIVGNDRGVLIEPNSAEALAEAVLDLADHPEKSARVGKNAQRFVADLDDWNQVALCFEDLLKEAVREMD